jgi:hypothetical protein
MALCIMCSGNMHSACMKLIICYYFLMSNDKCDGCWCLRAEQNLAIFFSSNVYCSWRLCGKSLIDRYAEYHPSVQVQKCVDDINIIHKHNLTSCHFGFYTIILHFLMTIFLIIFLSDLTLFLL